MTERIGETEEGLARYNTLRELYAGDSGS